MTQEEIERVVAESIRTVASGMGNENVRIARDISLVDTIGLDSMRFVDLTVTLEEALHLENFPMQAWVDQEYERPPGERFTVGALVEACMKATSGPGEHTA